jgi:mannosyltransferase
VTTEGPHVSRIALHIERLALLLLVLLALGLRVHRLGAQSLWYDEAVTAQVASQGIAELTRWTADDIQPPLYYYVTAAWTRLQGRGEWALRFPSLAAGVLIVPALWVLGRRLFGRDREGQLAALAGAGLAAVSPLYLYYSQEARMYTQLTLLGVLSGYALLRGMAAEQLRSRLVWWGGFVLSGAAMLYTHYFGAFLLLAYGVWFLIAWGTAAARAVNRTRAWGVLCCAALAFPAIGVLYLPWLPAMLTRYRVDRSYWQGALKLGEALRHVAISFTTGAPETMLETDAIRLLPWFGLLFAAAVIVLVARGRGDRSHSREQGSWVGDKSPYYALGYLLVTLLVPIMGVLWVASRTPKFNARYLMLASPSYLLILAGSIGALLGGQRVSGARLAPAGARRTRTALGVLVGLAAVLFLVGAAVVSIHNWFGDPAFTKAQWREVAAAIRARKAPDEAVLLVSGHAWPAWEYYAPDIPVTRLPEIDILDVEAVLGFETGPALGQALKDKVGAWLVSWQAEAVDPLQIVPYYLDRAGSEESQAAQFWQIGLRHWALRSGAVYPASPQPEQPFGANFGHKIALVGWDNPRQGRLTVYWQALQQLDRDYQVSLVVEDAAGKEVGRWDGRPARYDYPALRWRPGEAVYGEYELPLPAGAPEGDYTVTLAVYDPAEPSGLDVMDVADNPAGKRVRLGPVRVE